MLNEPLMTSQAELSRARNAADRKLAVATGAAAANVHFRSVDLCSGRARGMTGETRLSRLVMILMTRVALQLAGRPCQCIAVTLGAGDCAVSAVIEGDRAR